MRRCVCVTLELSFLSTLSCVVKMSDQSRKSLVILFFYQIQAHTHTRTSGHAGNKCVSQWDYKMRLIKYTNMVLFHHQNVHTMSHTHHMSFWHRHEQCLFNKIFCTCERETNSQRDNAHTKSTCHSSLLRTVYLLKKLWKMSLPSCFVVVSARLIKMLMLIA